MTSIKFINHASVIISNDKISLLSDPWYWGTAFHDGWSLIYENKEEDILNIISKITHIWISHEHPDHFSIQFFKKYASNLIERKIKILFQETKDKRVFNFLSSQGMDVEELKNKKIYFLSEKFKIKCIKSGFYDSALLLEVDNKTIFNLNDCPINEKKEIEKFRSKYGSCDILLTQFSYAAWKGGKKNLSWRQQAAADKITAVFNQAEILSAKIVLPFASHIRFSNILNSYLNDSVNTPDQFIKKIKQDNFKVFFFRPMEKQSLNEIWQDPQSLNFWREKYSAISNQSLIEYEQVESSEKLEDLYREYRKRIFKNNSYWIIWLVSKLKIFDSFQKINILVKDMNVTFSINLLSKNLLVTEEEPHIMMSSQSIKFIFLNSFGFDTLTVNGCFEEVKKGGFLKASKILALENLNNLGIFIKLSIIFRVDLFILYLNLLSKVSKKLK